VISGTPGEEPAVQAVRAGALDFLSKDRPRRIVPAVQRALREASHHRARVAAEHELRLSEERYRLGFDVAPEALLTYDLERRAIIDANARALALFGRTKEQLLATGFGVLSPPRQPDGRLSTEAGAEHLAQAMAGETPMFPWTVLVDGQHIPTEMRIILLPTATRKLARISIVDLRERLRIEEIARRSAELEMQNRRIQEANRLKSEFLANMSHELRTPLNAIIGFAELLHDGQVPPDSPTHQEFLGDILTSGRHLLQLIDDVLDLAKIEAGKLEFRPERVDLVRILNEVTAILRTTTASKALTIEIDIDPDLGPIVVDPARLKQVAYNYLSNAIKFTPPNGRVTVRARSLDGDRFRFEVEDTGIGIAEHDVTRLFHEFQQLEAGAAKRHQGTGLGLALTRRLVEAQGGSVGVKSTAGKGSTFHAVLPRHATTLVEPDQRPRSVAREGARSVLVVEDDLRDQAQLVSALAGAGYAVELAATGAEALARWRTRTFDAITIDLLLPDMSGLDLLAALSTEPRKLSVPVIVVTVVPDAKVVAGFEVHEILPKPLDRDSLVASLARAGVHATGTSKSEGA
jgi:signal transduction histidine kinase